MSTLEDDTRTTEDDERDERGGGEVPSIVDTLRARREALAATHPYEILPVPGYDEALQVRFSYPAGGHKRVVKALEVAQNTSDDEAALNGNCDAILACVDTLLGRDPDGGAWRDLRTNEEVDPTQPVERPVTFSKDLAAMLGFDVPDDLKGPARFIVRNVFSPRASATGVYDGDIALMTTGGRLLTWLQDTSQSTSEAFSGG